LCRRVISIANSLIVARVQEHLGCATTTTVGSPDLRGIRLSAGQTTGGAPVSAGVSAYLSITYMPPITAIAQTTPSAVQPSVADFLWSLTMRCSLSGRLLLAQILVDRFQQFCVLERLVQIVRATAFKAPSDNVVSTTISQENDRSFRCQAATS